MEDVFRTKKKVISMATNKEKLMGVIGIIVAVTATILLTPDEFDNAYVCPLTNESGVFWGGLSGSQERGYPLEGTRKGYEDCDAGVRGTESYVRSKWVPINEWLELHGLSKNQYLISPEPSDTPQKYDCSHIKDFMRECVEKRTNVCMGRDC